MKLPIHAEIAAAFEARDPAQVARLYADDSVFVTPGRPPVIGRAAVARVMEEDFQDPGFSLNLIVERTIVASSGDLACTRGKFRASFTNPQTNEVQSVGGTYLQVFRRRSDARWEVLEDISSPGPSALEAGAAEPDG